MRSSSTHVPDEARRVPEPPPDSELPEAAPPPTTQQVVRPPGVAGGLDNIPEELLSPDEQLNDELDHAGMDQVLPGEDQARPRSGEAARDQRPN
jgi:hypothetical protein